MDISLDLYKPMDELRPTGKRPPNFRHFSIGGLNVAILANPELYGSPYGAGVKPDEGIDSNASIRKIQALGIRWLIALDRSEFDTIKARWNAALGDKKGSITLCHIDDLTPPTLEIFEKVHGIAKEAQRSDSGIAVYCRGGFGRSGTVVASLFLRHLLDSAGAEAPSEGDFSVADMGGEAHKTTQTVHHAIKKVREKDPKGSFEIHVFNPRSDLYGTSIESKSQIAALQTLETSLK